MTLEHPVSFVGEVRTILAKCFDSQLPSRIFQSYGAVLAHSIRPEPLGHELDAEWLMAEGSTKP